MLLLFQASTTKRAPSSPLIYIYIEFVYVYVYIESMFVICPFDIAAFHRIVLML